MAPQTALILFAGWFCVAPKRAIEAMEAQKLTAIAGLLLAFSIEAGLWPGITRQPGEQSRDKSSDRVGR